LLDYTKNNGLATGVLKYALIDHHKRFNIQVPEFQQVINYACVPGPALAWE